MKMVRLVCLLLLGVGCVEPAPLPPRSAEPPAIVAEGSVRADSTGNATLDRAIREQLSNQWVEVSGVVVKLLPDDRKGSRHQRFLLRLGDGTTVLVAHNIDLASRAPVREGDEARLRGEYEWNEKGGVLHWTHHDPKGRHQGGWIEVDGQRVR